MRNDQNRFLQSFKAVELQIKNSHKTPDDANFKWYEDNVAAPDVQAKMRLCRTLRNFLVHEPSAEIFCEVNEAQIDFLHTLSSELADDGDFVSNIVFDREVCYEMREVIEQWRRQSNKILCYDGTNLYLVTGEQVKQQICNNDYDFYHLAHCGRQLPFVLGTESCGNWVDKDFVAVDAERNILGVHVVE